MAANQRKRKGNSRGSGGCGVRSIPEDIILEMLVRLPAKALCRFRCVSKAWCTLICDPTFVAAQRSRAGAHIVGVFFEDCWPPEVRVMDMDGNVIRVFELTDMDDGNAFGILQLATARLNNLIIRGHCIGANPMITEPDAGRACTVDLGCATPTGALLTFGRVPVSGAFKVMYVQETPPFQICKIATVMDGGAAAKPLRWRQKSTPPFYTSWWPKRMVTLNGVVHCLPPPFSEHGAASSGSHRIAAFDLESEEWKIINGPALGIQEETLYANLVELKGTLSLVQSLCNGNYNDQYYAIVIWLLIDFHKSVWVKEYTIQMPRTWGLTNLLGSLDDGTILLLVSQTKQNKAGSDTQYALVFYNPSIKAFTKSVDIAKGFDDILVLYTGSLLS